MSKTRLEAFSDGVFAIVITLLALDLRVPASDDAGLARAIQTSLPRFGAYVLSFAVIGVYWVAHHSFFAFIAKVDRTLLWLNNLTLLAVSVLPIPTSVLGQHPRSSVAIALYGGNLVAINLAGCAVWVYATYHSRLVPPKLPDWYVRFVLLLHGAPVVVYGAAVALGPWWPRASLVLFALMTLFFILPNPLLTRRAARASGEVSGSES
jgi:uncharacterized membrane protein